MNRILSLWQRFQDPCIVLLISAGLMALYTLLLRFFTQQLDHMKEYNFDELSLLVDAYLLLIKTAVILLSLLTTPVAIYCSATNDRFSFPIRLLATAENITKLIYALLSGIYFFCLLSQEALNWPDDLIFWVEKIFVLLGETKYSLIDMAQYCQFLISLSRFLVVTFDSAYFRYTMKWPIVQLLFPYLLRIGLELLKDPPIENLLNWPLYGWINDYVVLIPYFLMCGLDFVTNFKMKKLKKKGTVSRAESLLMIQMISNSLITIFSYILLYFLGIILNFFFGFNVLWLLFESIYLIKAFLFHLVASIISILCFWKRKEHLKNGKTITVSSVMPTSSARSVSAPPIIMIH